MDSTVETLDGDRVRLSVTVDADEFEVAVDAAFRRIGQGLRLPGFRPGKAPRRVLEARIGLEAGRQEALEHALPTTTGGPLSAMRSMPSAVPRSGSPVGRIVVR